VVTLDNLAEELSVLRVLSPRRSCSLTIETLE
jgi:hypothetical protein